jgi:hypothetical protein
MKRLVKIYEPDNFERELLLEAKKREIAKHKKIIEQLKADISAL